MFGLSEVERLTRERDEAWAERDSMEAVVIIKTAERDEARAEVVNAHRLQALAPSASSLRGCSHLELR